jgi:AraC family transcriptional regulator of adaptative response/methylated-DNA-[protein]-cysteine methyltransferase
MEMGDSIRFAVGECSLGAVVVATSAKGICAVLLGDDAAAAVGDLRDRFPAAQQVEDRKRFEPVVAKVVDFIALCEIPAGSTATYSDIALRLGAPKEAYLVGEACAANPNAVAIPCHRVVRKDGSLAGYRWGLKRQRALLQREAAA